MTTPIQTKLTQEQLNKWLARLRDPNSKQSKGACGTVKQAGDSLYEVPSNDSMCCLVHGQYILEGRAIVADHTSDYWAWANKLSIPSDILAAMNDEGEYTLSQVADWIEKNLLPIQEGGN